ncbi:MAG: hypothetical protein ACOYEF_00720 [Planifilum sp.]
MEFTGAIAGEPGTGCGDKRETAEGAGDYWFIPGRFKRPKGSAHVVDRCRLPLQVRRAC